jgi:site-specific DNA-methyltransferase (adenine-specific)/site-specific DNA-methyltransferase (cytosine-N4-specific)
MKIRDRIKEFRRVKASELSPNPRNWRTHPKHQQDALKGILAEVGIADALIARELPDGSLELIDGHLRAETMPDQEVPVLILDVDQDEAHKLLTVLDPMAAMAETNTEALGSLLQEMQTESEGVEAMLKALAEEEGIDLFADCAEDLVDPEPQIDRAEELQVEWKTESGQLWEVVGEKGTHRVLCGDCRDSGDVERLCVSPVDGCFTSPPYASQRKYDDESGFKPIDPDDYVEWWKPLQENVRSVLMGGGSFFVNIKPSADILDTSLYVFDVVCTMVRKWKWHFATELCWERGGVPKQVVRRFKNQFEPVYQFTKDDWKSKMRPEAVRHVSGSVPIAGGVGVGNTSWGNERQGVGGDAVLPNESEPGLAYPGNRIKAGQSEALGHSAAFPIGLPSFFMKAYSDEGDVWLDPFLGSGTTLIAAEQLNRTCYGIEISPKYVAVILQRCKDAGMAPRLVS